MSASNPHRTAVACFPCRRKRIKCPGEKPGCSQCHRLKQECFYASCSVRGSRRRTPRATGSSSRAPSSRMSSGVLASTTPQGDLTPTNSPSGHLACDIDQISNNNEPLVPHQPTSYPTFSIWNTTSLQNPDAASSFGLIPTYNRYVHGQPVTLFNPDSLAREVATWPYYMHALFFALTARFIDATRDTDKIVEIARRDIMLQAATSLQDLQLVEGLCLLVLLDASNRNPFTGFVLLGMAKRICALGFPGHCERRMRCWQACITLDRIHCPAEALSDQTLELYERHQDNPAKFSGSKTEHGTLSPVQDIRRHLSDLQGVWASSMRFVRHVKRNGSAHFWKSGSLYHNVLSELLEFESNLPYRHRLKGTGFLARSSSDIEADRFYWVSWFALQLLYHATQVVIHHPLLHVVGFKPEDGHQPLSFVEQTLNLAFLHSRWVAQLVRYAAQKGLKSYDPFLAHLVIASATCLVFFLPCPDSERRTLASRDLMTCSDFIRSSVRDWPYLERTVRVIYLRYYARTHIFQSHIAYTRAQKSKLADLVQQASEEPNDVGGPYVSADLVWNLLCCDKSTDYTPEESDLSTIALKASTDFPRLDETHATSIEPSVASQNAPEMESEHHLEDYNVDTEDLLGLTTFIHSSLFEDDLWAGYGQL